AVLPPRIVSSCAQAARPKASSNMTILLIMPVPFQNEPQWLLVVATHTGEDGGVHRYFPEFPAFHTLAHSHALVLVTQLQDGARGSAGVKQPYQYHVVQTP